MSSLSKTKNLDDVKIEDILSKVHEYIEDEEQVKVIERAYSFALKKHIILLKKNMKDNLERVERLTFIIR